MWIDTFFTCRLPSVIDVQPKSNAMQGREGSSFDLLIKWFEVHIHMLDLESRTDQQAEHQSQNNSHSLGSGICQVLR